MFRSRSFSGFSMLVGTSGSSRYHSKIKLVVLLMLVVVCVASIYGIIELSHPKRYKRRNLSSRREKAFVHSPHLRGMSNSTRYKIGIVADMDKKSKIEGEKLGWRSIFKTIVIEKKNDAYTVEFLEERQLTNKLSEGGLCFILLLFFLFFFIFQKRKRNGIIRIGFFSQ